MARQPQYIQRVLIIVGGSIAGLTLSHCLNAAGIDNIVLEKHAEITSQVGASIGVLPNGAHILDQLGVFSKIGKLIEPLTSAHIAYPDGFILTSDYPVVVKERFGRAMVFLSRQELIQVLHSSFEDASHVHVNQRVAKVQQGKDRIRGNLVGGADSVHSKVRSEMWPPVDDSLPAYRLLGLTVEFSCIFGMSSAVTGLEVGEQVSCLYDGFTIMTYQGLGGRVYWLVVEKLDRKYIYPPLPRFSQQDAIDGCERHGGIWLRNTVHFRDVWANRETFAMTPLEEGLLRPWHSRRIVCVGDSIHKPTGQEVDGLLQSLQRKHSKRATHVCTMSAITARLHTRQGLFYSLIGRCLPAYFPTLPAELISVVVEGGNYLPLPDRQGTGWVIISKSTAVGLVLLMAMVGAVMFVTIVLSFLVSGTAANPNQLHCFLTVLRVRGLTSGYETWSH
ncbi:hypothetical protein BDW59DRAFT_173571 [Aspergillus cavernicola]|uniref:FAD-binding domain-containing protein n=1 Tax=Aspergillus cavernicola TaxID=176166 RepID=A0ABR4I648_9EURO